MRGGARRKPAVGLALADLSGLSLGSGGLGWIFVHLGPLLALVAAAISLRIGADLPELSATPELWWGVAATASVMAVSSRPFNNSLTVVLTLAGLGIGAVAAAWPSGNQKPARPPDSGYF